MNDDITVNEHLKIKGKGLSFSFIHASGPGGQKVNKTATAAQLRYALMADNSLPPDVKARLLTNVKNRTNSEGELIITARRFRSQEKNKADAILRLKALVLKAAVPPRPRRPTRQPKAARKKRLDEKKRRGETKRLRRPPC